MRKLYRIPILVSLLTLAALALRFWRLGDMPLFADEAYYLLWADRLAPAYFDHPAGIAILLRLSTVLGGRGEFGVRWLNAVLSALCVPLAYTAGRRYVNSTGGIIAAVAVALAPVYILTGRVAYPDSLQYCLLLLNLLAFAGVLGTRVGPWRWAWFGFALALLLNVKLSGAFYAAALTLFVLLRRRDLLRQQGLWLAAAIALLGVTPLLGWNLAHDWVGVRWALFQGQGFGFAPAGLMARLAHAGSYLTPPVVLLAALAAAIFLANLAPEILNVSGIEALAGLVHGHDSQETGSSLDSSTPATTKLRIPGLAQATQQAATSTPKPERRRVAAIQNQPAGREATPAPGLLALAAAFLLAPVLFSAADNPRNLGVGLLPLWPLAGLALEPRRSRVWSALAIALLAWTGAFGAGTVAALLGPTPLPHSRAASVIRADAAGWPAFGRDFAPQEGSPIFTVDYSIAGQVSYYTGRPVHSAGGQFRIWGIPKAADLTVLSQGYIPPEVITERLRADFTRVEGPRVWEYTEGTLHKTVFIWQAAERTAPMAQVVEDLDYFSLARETGNALR